MSSIGEGGVEMWETIQQRWQWVLLGLVIVAVAVVWAIFPSLLGGAGGMPGGSGGDGVAPGTDGPAQMTRIRCSPCPMFQVPDEMISASSSAYDHEALESRVQGGDSVTWAVQGPAPVNVPVGFTVSNDSDQQQIVVNSLEVLLTDFREVPQDLTLGCLPAQGGGLVEAVSFQVALDPARVDVALEVPLEQAPGQVTLLEPSGIQPYLGDMELPATGYYTLIILADYDTSGGESMTVRSAPLEVLLVPLDAKFNALPPEEIPQTTCPPHAAE